MRQVDASRQDYQRENVLLRCLYCLLYEELTYAMNAGDVGRVEACMTHWICIFKATGKHKYARQMLHFLKNVHFVYPKPLGKIVRYNILCNPTGKAHHFRAIDWVVEWNNLFMKTIYAGKYSTHTLERIFRDSPLIHLFRDCHLIAEKVFALHDRTVRHAPSDLVHTYREVQSRLAKLAPFTVHNGWPTTYEVPNMVEKGMSLLQTSLEMEGESGDGDVDGDGDVEMTEENDVEQEADGDDLAIDATGL